MIITCTALVREGLAAAGEGCGRGVHSGVRSELWGVFESPDFSVPVTTPSVTASGGVTGLKKSEKPSR